MIEREQRPNAGHDIDADIVCASCGLENEHGTLICRQCGNNLRDQRRNRLAEMAAGLETERKASRRRMLSGLLSVFGIVAIIAVAINLEAIATYLAGGDGSSGGVSYWRGEPGRIFDEMIAVLEADPPSATERASAIAAPAAVSTPNGRYVLAAPGAAAMTEVGLAAVRELDGQAYFCALLDGGGEVRGIGNIDAAGRMTTEGGVLDFRGVRAAGVGYAAPSPQGGFTVYGASMAEDGGQFELVAFPIAESGGG